MKLQALVRGHIVRKQAADMLRRMQALIRAQSRARLGRSMVFESPPFSTKSTQSIHHVSKHIIFLISFYFLYVTIMFD